MPNESPQFNVLLRSEQSNGEVATIEIVLPAGSAGPPLHHHDFDEAFYVLDGELTFQLGEELATAGPGTLTFAPRGLWRRPKPAPARWSSCRGRAAISAFRAMSCCSTARSLRT